MDRTDDVRATVERLEHDGRGGGRTSVRVRLAELGGLRALSGWWTAAFVVQWILLAVLTVVVIALARQIGVLHLRVSPVGALEVDEEGPPLGAAPEPRLARSRDSGSLTLGGPGPRRLVAFVSPTCPICEEVAPSLPAAARAHGLASQVIEDADAEAAYDVPGVPFVVVLDELGVTRAKGTVNSLEQIDGLVDTAIERMRSPVEVAG